MAKFYTFFFQGDDGLETEYQMEKEVVSGYELMDLLGIAHEIGLVWLKDDGTQQFIGASDLFTFSGPGRRIKKAPMFKRG